MGRLKMLIGLSLGAVLLLVYSCEKNTAAKSDSFLSIVDTDTDYFTRSCFQLNDGSYIIVGTGENAAVMAGFSSVGELKWQKALPGKLFGVKKGMPLPAGGFILAGADSTSKGITQENGIVSVVQYDNAGNEIRSAAFSSIPLAGNINQMDFTLLQNGNIAFCFNTIAAVQVCYPRLLIIDQFLNPVADYVYYASPGIPYVHLSIPHVQESSDGSIYLGFRIEKQDYNAAAVMKLKPVDYSVEYFIDEVAAGSSALPGDNFVIDQHGNLIFGSAKPSSVYPRLMISYHEGVEFSLGNEVSMIQVDDSGNFIQRMDYTGLAPLTALMKVIRTSDGGFVMVGTSNQDPSFTFSSNTRIFVIRTDGNFNQLWKRQIHTTYPGVGYDIFECEDGGYVVGAFQKSFNKNFKMMMIKMDENGN